MILIEFTGAVDATGTTQTFYVSDRAFTTAGAVSATITVTQPGTDPGNLTDQNGSTLTDQNGNALTDGTASVPPGTVTSTINLPGDSPADTEFKPCLLDPGAISFSIYGSASAITGGSAALQIGEIIATNIDGDWDALTSVSFDGRPLIMRVGEGGSYPADFPAVLYATMSSVDVGWDQLILNVEDASYVFDKPILNTRFRGDNILPDGVQGTANDIAGQIVPRMYGKVSQIGPYCVNTARQVYKVNDGPVDAISAVQIRGADQTLGADYPNADSLLQATVAAGSYATCLSQGLFKLGVTPDGQVTADASEGATLGRSAARLLSRLAMDSGVYGSLINTADADRLHGLNQADLGFYIDDQSTYRDYMDRIARTVGAWYAFDTQGVMRMGRLDVPVGLPVATLERHDIVDGGIDRLVLSDVPTPYWSVTVNYGRIYQVQTNDLVGTVTADRRAYLAQQYRAAEDHDSTVQAQFRLANPLTIDSLFVDQAPALAEAQRVRQMRGQAQDWFDVPVPITRASELITGGLWLGSELALDLGSRFDLSGRSFIVVGINIQRKAKQIVFRLWAPTARPAVTFAPTSGVAAVLTSASGAAQNASGPAPTAGRAAAVTGASGVSGNAAGGSGSGQPVGLLLAVTSQTAILGNAGAGRASATTGASATSQSPTPTAGRADATTTATGQGRAVTSGGGGGTTGPGVQVQSVQTVTQALRTNTSVPKPTTTATGDLLLVIFHTSNNTQTADAITPPAGWASTGLPALIAKPDPWHDDVGCYWKIASASEPASYTFTHAATYSDAVIYDLSGPDQSTPLGPSPTFNVYPYASTNTQGAAPVATPVTTTRADSELIYVLIGWDGSTPDAPPTGFATRAALSFYVADQHVTAAGTNTGTLPVSLSVNGMSSPWIVGLIAVEPPGVTGIWDTAAHDSGWSSTDGLTADKPGWAFGAVLGNTGRARNDTGDHSFSLLVNTRNSMDIGLALQSITLTARQANYNPAAGAATSIQVTQSGAVTDSNGTSLAQLGQIAVGDTVQVRQKNGLGYFRRYDHVAAAWGPWNGNSGTYANANADGGTGGIPLTGFNAASLLYPYVCADMGNVTADFRNW